MAPIVHVPLVQVPMHVWVLVCDPVPVPHEGEHADQPVKDPQYDPVPVLCVDVTMNELNGTYTSNRMLQR